MQDRVGSGGVPENRTALLAVLLAQPQLDRTALEIREKASAVSKYYADFTSFSGAITDCLAQTHTQHKTALDSLLTLRFQTLREPQNIAA